jgi:SAM-dependent methyltransferase
VDVLLRPASRIPVREFDGQHLPFPDQSFDVVMFVDVLHHTNDPAILLREAKRVARVAVVLKDHTQDGPFAYHTLRFMDWVGNAHHGVALPYNYWPGDKWRDAFAAIGLAPERWNSRLGLYPFPASLIFDRNLHFVARLTGQK